MATPLTLPQLESIAGPTLTLCRTWDMIRKDGKALYLTDHDRAIEFGPKRYVPVRSFASSANVKGGGFRERDKEFRGAIDSDLIREEDILAKLYADCEIKEAVVDWAHPERGQFLKDRYWIKTIGYDGRVFTAGVEGLSGWTDKPFGRNYTRDCTYNLGDQNCRADTSAYELASEVASLLEDSEGEPAPYNHEFVTATISVSPNDVYRQNGILTWTSGLNAGLSQIIRGHNTTTSRLSLWLEPIFPIAPGDTFDLFPGCSKIKSYCKEVFNNVLNFGGFPYLIGQDEMVETPDSK